MAAPPIRIHISTCAPRATSASWGDTEYAEALARAIRAQGHEAELFFSGEAPALRGPRDVVLRITGPHLDDTVPGVPNLLWLISMPNYIGRRALARFQGVFVPSAALAGQYRDQGLPAAYLAQATDPDLFHPGKRDPGAKDLPLVFVGNHGPRAPRRLIRQVAALMPAQLSVWGDGWAGKIPAECLRATRLPYADLPALYARSRVVLNSHMDHMARLGIMSNRSFDAIAAGAVVLSDRVTGFNAPDLPELHQCTAPAQLETLLQSLLDAPPPSLAQRLDRNARIRQGYSFTERARLFLDAAQRLLDEDACPPPLFASLAPLPPAQAAPVTVELRDDAHAENRHLPGDDIAALDRALAAGPVRLVMRLCDPASMPGCPGTAMAMLRAALAVQRILAVLARRPRLAGLELVQESGEGNGLIHPMMTDLRRAQALLRNPPETEATHLALRAQRLTDHLLSEPGEASILQARPLPDHYLVRVMRNHPLYRGEGPSLDWDRRKLHLALWPRKAGVTLDRPLGVFVHLFYPELARPIAERLARIDAPLRLYVSTTDAAKAERIRAEMPQAEIRILPNRGRDIAPKFFGFGEAHAGHDIVLHLHGKRSAFTAQLDGWLDHILNCLLPEPAQINRILSFFKDIDALGLIAPQTFRPTLRAAHWGRNLDLAQEIGHRLGWDAPLPDDEGLHFPAGSMFWARTEVLQPLLDLRLTPQHFPPESGQIDATPAHAIERMIGLCCQQAGKRMIRVAPADNTDFPQQKLRLNSNGALRALLADQTRRNEI